MVGHNHIWNNFNVFIVFVGVFYTFNQPFPENRVMRYAIDDFTEKILMVEYARCDKENPGIVFGKICTNLNVV